MQSYNYEEMILLRILELNNLQPHYWSELFVLFAQLLSEEEKSILGRMITMIEKSVLEEEMMINVYQCKKCMHRWKSKKDWFEIQQCERCKYPDVKRLQERLTFYDVEFVLESNRDYTSYFERYGEKITKNSIEKKLTDCKAWLFQVVRERSEKRRFKRFK